MRPTSIRTVSSSITFLLSELTLISFGFVLTHFGGGLASGRHFEIGSVYSYDYVLGVELNEPAPLTNYSYPWDETATSGYRTGSTVGYQVLCQVKVSPIWQSEHDGSILEIQLVKPQLQIKSRKAPSPEGFHDHTSELDSATLHPLYIHWKEGIVHSTYSVDGDDISLINIKKGVANLLQFQIGKTNTTENTPRGQCPVIYSNKDSSHLSKTITSECLLPAEAMQGDKYVKTSHNSAVLGSTTQSSVKVILKLTADSFVEDASVTENHVVRVNAKKEVGATVDASQHLKLTGSTNESIEMVQGTNVDIAILEIGKLKELKLIVDSLIPHPEKIPLCEVTNCKAVDTLLSTMVPENMATTKLANAFIQLVEKIKTSTTEDIEKLLEENPEKLPQLLDACAATGTKNTHKAVLKVVNFDSPDEVTNPERYLLGLSLTTTPDIEIVNDLFGHIRKGVNNEKLQESLILTTAALVHTIRTQQSKNFEQDFETFVLSSLENCPEEKAECSQLYLRALKNLKSESTVTKLFEIVQKLESKVGIVGMKALHSMPDSYFNRTIHRPLLIRIINQLGKKYDSSTRTLGIDIILRDNPTKDEVREILIHQLKTTNPLHAEVGTFLWNRLHEFSVTNPALGSYIQEIIHEEGLKNYNHLSPKGLSTSFSRTFTSNPSGNSTFSNAIEMTGKILKRSSFDVYLHSDNSFIHPLSLGIFAGGLSSFASSDNSDNAAAAVVEDDAEEATAGMELTLMGVQTRPIIFFVGKGELMGLVWSGAGSEKTTALQGNILLQNERASIPLYNGLVADVNIQGGLSFDLSGQIAISLWHRTANSLVQNKAGLVLQSVIRVDTSFVRSRVDYTVATEAMLDFTSDINFYDGVLMCLKLTQPEFSIKQNIHKTERIPGSKHRLRKAKYNTVPIPGITYALNKKNSELCGVMYKDEL